MKLRYFIVTNSSLDEIKSIPLEKDGTPEDHLYDVIKLDQEEGETYKKFIDELRESVKWIGKWVADPLLLDAILQRIRYVQIGDVRIGYWFENWGEGQST